MEFKTLLAIDLDSIPEDISWGNIKTKLNYLLDTRNVIYVSKINLAWETFVASGEAERVQCLQNLLQHLQQEEELRLKISELLSLYRNKNIKPENIAEFLGVQHNFSQLLGYEDIHMAEILLHIEWLLEAVLLIKQQVLKKINDKEKQKTANAEADALVMQIKEYEAAVCANILTRLEGLAKYGFIDNLGLIAVASVANQTIKADDFNISIWDENKFQKYYFFVRQQGDVKQIEKLQNLVFDFGTIYVTADNKIAAYPKIYTKGELLLVKPWFSWLRPGAAARYNLFAKGFLQIDLNTKIKLAENAVADFECDSMLLAQERLASVFSAIDGEADRVRYIQKYLWRYLYAKENELCERWQTHLVAVNENIHKIQLLQLQQLTSRHDVVLSLILNKKALLIYADIVQLLDNNLALCTQSRNNFFKVIFTAILQVLLRHNLQAKKYMQVLSALFASDITASIKIIIGDSYYNDAILLFSSLSNIDDAKLLFAVIAKYLEEEHYAGLLQNFFRVSIADNNKVIAMQAYLNRKFMQGHIVSNTSLQELQSICGSSYALVNPYVADFNIADKYYEHLESVLAVKYLVAADFFAAVNGALAMCKGLIFSYRLRLELASKLQYNCYYDAAYLPIVLEYGNLATKEQYCFGIFKSKLQTSSSLHLSLIACDYYNIIEYDKELGAVIDYEIKQYLVTMLITEYASATLADLKQLFKDIAADDAILMNFPLDQQESINAFIAMKFASCWSPAASYVISLFASDLVERQYYLKLFRTLAIECAYNASIAESFAYLKELNADDDYYWSIFGLQDENMHEVVSHISFAITSAQYKDDRAEFLDFIFSNKLLVQFYKVTELHQTWESKKLLLVSHNQLENLMVKLSAPDSSFDDLSAVVELLTKHDFNNATTIIAKVIGFIWSYFRTLIEQSVISEDLSELIKYKTQIISKLGSYKFLTIEQQYELKFLAWLTTMGPYILNSNLVFWRLSQDIAGKHINCLTLYLYYINYYPKQYAAKVHAKFRTYQKYMSNEGIVRLFCEDIDDYQEGLDPFPAAQEVVIEESPQLKLQLAMAEDLKLIDVTNIADIERENAIDSLNYLIEFAASTTIESEARAILNKLSPAVLDSYSPSFFKSQTV